MQTEIQSLEPWFLKYRSESRKLVSFLLRPGSCGGRTDKHIRGTDTRVFHADYLSTLQVGVYRAELVAELRDLIGRLELDLLSVREVVKTTVLESFVKEGDLGEATSRLDSYKALISWEAEELRTFSVGSSGSDVFPSLLMGGKKISAISVWGTTPYWRLFDNGWDKPLCSSGLCERCQGKLDPSKNACPSCGGRIFWATGGPIFLDK